MLENNSTVSNFFRERLSLSRLLAIELLPLLRRSTVIGTENESRLNSEAIASCVGRAAATLQRAVEDTYKISISTTEKESTPSPISAVASLLIEEEKSLNILHSSPLRSTSTVSVTSTLASDRQLIQKASISLLGSLRLFGGAISSDTEALRSWLAVVLLERLRMSSKALTSILRIQSFTLPRFLESVDSCFFSLDLQGSGSLGLQELCVLFLIFISQCRQNTSVSIVLSDPNLFLCASSSLGALISNSSEKMNSSPRRNKQNNEKETLSLLRTGESALLQRMGIVSLPSWRAFMTIMCTEETNYLSSSSSSFSSSSSSSDDEDTFSALKSVNSLRDHIERACSVIYSPNTVTKQTNSSSVPLSKRVSLQNLWAHSCEDVCLSAIQSASTTASFNSSSISSSITSKDIASLKITALNKDITTCAYNLLVSSLVVIGGGALMAVVREGRSPLDEASLASVTTSVVSNLEMLPSEAILFNWKENDVDSSDLTHDAILFARNVAQIAVLGAIREFMSNLQNCISVTINTIEESLWQGQEADTSAIFLSPLPPFVSQTALDATMRAITMRDEKVLRSQALNMINTTQKTRSILFPVVTSHLTTSFDSKMLEDKLPELYSSQSQPRQPLQPLVTWSPPPKSPLHISTLSSSNKEKKSVNMELVIEKDSLKSVQLNETYHEILNTSSKLVEKDMSSTTVPTLMISIDELIEAEAEDIAASEFLTTLHDHTKNERFQKYGDSFRKKSIEFDQSIYTIDDVGDALSLSVINSVGEPVHGEPVHDELRQNSQQNLQARSRVSFSPPSLTSTIQHDKKSDDLSNITLQNVSLSKTQVVAIDNNFSTEDEGLTRLRLATEKATLPPIHFTTDSSLSQSPSILRPFSVSSNGLISPNKVSTLLKSPNDDETEDAPLEFQPIRLAPSTTSAFLSSSAALGNGFSPPQRGSQLSGSRLGSRGLSMSALAYSPRRKGNEREKPVNVTSAQTSTYSTIPATIPSELTDEYHTLLIRQAQLLDRVLDPTSLSNNSDNNDGISTREGLLLALRVVRDRVKAIDNLAVNVRGQTVQVISSSALLPSTKINENNPFASPSGVRSNPLPAVDISRFFPASPYGVASSLVGTEDALQRSETHRLDVDNSEDLLMRITSRLPLQKIQEPLYKQSMDNHSNQRGHIRGRSRAEKTTQQVSNSIRAVSLGNAKERHTVSSHGSSSSTGGATTIQVSSRSRSRSSSRVEQHKSIVPASFKAPLVETKTSSRARNKSREATMQHQQQQQQQDQKTLSTFSGPIVSKNKVSMRGQGRALSIETIPPPPPLPAPPPSNRLSSLSNLPVSLDSLNKRSTPRPSISVKSPSFHLWQSVFPVSNNDSTHNLPPITRWASALSNEQANGAPMVEMKSVHTDENVIEHFTTNYQSADGFVLTPPSQLASSSSLSSSSSSSSSKFQLDHASSSSTVSDTLALLPPPPPPPPPTCTTNFSSPTFSSDDSSAIKLKHQHQQQVSAYMSHPRLRRFMREGHLVGSSPPINKAVQPSLPPQITKHASVSSINRLHSGLPTHPSSRKG
jgi:hypothetical protein